GRQPRGQHRLAGAGRSDHEEIVATGGGDLERALGALLALDVLEIGERAIDFADLRLRTGEHLRAAEMIGELNERRGGDDLHFGARPGGFGAAGGGADETFAARVGADPAGSTPATAAIEPSRPSSPSSGSRCPRTPLWRRAEPCCPCLPASVAENRAGDKNNS